MLIRLKVKHLGEEKDISLGETIGSNLGNVLGRKAISCRSLSALLFHYTETFKTCTTRFPSISLNSKEDFKRHPLIVSVLLLTSYGFQQRGSSLQVQMVWKRIVASMCAFHFALRYRIPETKLVMENSQEVLKNCFCLYWFKWLYKVL